MTVYRRLKLILLFVLVAGSVTGAGGRGIDLSQCKEATPSYRVLPADTEIPSAWGRNALCDEVRTEPSSVLFCLFLSSLSLSPSLVALFLCLPSFRFFLFSLCPAFTSFKGPEHGTHMPCVKENSEISTLS